MAARGASRIGGPEYRIQIDISAPLDFVYRWCTDFDPADGPLENESYRRKVVERTKRRVVYEDLEEGRDGFLWSRMEVTLSPPDAWHADGIGSHRSMRGDYKLHALGPERTRLELRWRRKPTGLSKVKMSKRERERTTLANWDSFRRALERDYRKSGKRRTTH